MKVATLIACLILVSFSKIALKSPDELKEEFKPSNYSITTSYSNFGIIPYGKSLKGRLYYDPNN